jgi:hypothetical protein
MSENFLAGRGAWRQLLQPDAQGHRGFRHGNDAVVGLAKDDALVLGLSEEDTKISSPNCSRGRHLGYPISSSQNVHYAFGSPAVPEGWY